MYELREKIWTILQKPQLASLATIAENSKPWVRYVMIVAKEDLTIRFATFLNARKVNQIKVNPEVHLTCGIDNPDVMVPYLQVQGTAALDASQEARHSFWNTMLSEIFEGPDDPNYGVIEIKPYRIEYCTPGSTEAEVWDASKDFNLSD